MKSPYWAIFRFDTYSGKWEEEHEFEATDTRQYRLKTITDYRQSSGDSFKLQRVFPKC